MTFGLFSLGDMIQTAISVARNCGMVAKDEKVILVHAHAPDKEEAARIEWEEAEHPGLSAEEEEEETAGTTVMLDADAEREVSVV